MTTIHLIANAHLDPVWLWDWREGFTEGITTCSTILDLMDEAPELTFIRGEAAIYEHIERFAPETFSRIREMVAAGRWDVVGGTYIQPDTNLPSTRTLLRHFERGRAYFSSRFGRAPTVAWAADSFGHSAGLPDILAQSGMTGFAFTRPYAGDLPLPGPTFWWEGVGGARVLACRPQVGAYLTERDELPRKLDACREAAEQSGISHQACFYGVGNHGGGPTRSDLQAIRRWQEANPGVTVVHSGLHRLFEAFREQAARDGEGFFPTFRGELNFCLRGCYSTAARVKFAYRRAEAAVERAETTARVVGEILAGSGVEAPAPALDEAWDAILVNSFHDVLPGSSIERALEEQIDWLGGARHAARKAELQMLSALAARVDTTVPAVPGSNPSAVPFLVWNPHPHPFRDAIELEAALDYRPLFAYQGRVGELPLEVRGPDGESLPFQKLETEHDSWSNVPWRARVLVPVDLAPGGWSVLTLGAVEEARTLPEWEGAPATATGTGVIDNGIFRIQADEGECGIAIQRHGIPFLREPGLSAVTVEDPWGSWGGMNEESESLDLSQVRDRWRIGRVVTIEEGPHRAAMWVVLNGGHSRLELVLRLTRGRGAVDVSARLLWNETAARLKLVMPLGVNASTPMEFAVPGGSVSRLACGEVPGNGWVRVAEADFGFASDALYNFDSKDGALRATICRATRYAMTDRETPGTQKPWRGVLDAGELKFQFVLAPGDEELPRRSLELTQPPLAVAVVPAEGPWTRSGSL